MIRKTTFEVYLDALKPIEALLEAPKPGFPISNDPLTDSANCLKTCKEITKHKLRHDAKVKRQQGLEDNFALQDEFEKFVEDPALFLIETQQSNTILPSTSPIEATETANTPSKQVDPPTKALEPPVDIKTVNPPSEQVDPPTQELEAPADVKTANPPSEQIDPLTKALEPPADVKTANPPSEQIDPLTKALEPPPDVKAVNPPPKQVDYPTKALEPPANAPNFFFLTTPAGNKKLTPFFDHDEKGMLKIKVTPHHRLREINATSAKHFPGLCDPKDSSRPYRIVINASHDLINVYGEKRKGALEMIMRALLRTLFPRRKNACVEVKGQDQDFKLNRRTSSTTGQYIFRPRLVFDYSAHPDDNLDRTVIIVNMKLKSPNIEITLLHQDDVEKEINATIKNMIKVEMEEGKVNEINVRPRAPCVNEQKKLSESEKIQTNTAAKKSVHEEEENSRKRPWNNDEDPSVEDGTAQTNKRRKRGDGTEGSEGQAVEPVEESDSSVSSKSLEELMSEPTVTIHGMDDFNPEEWA